MGPSLGDIRPCPAEGAQEVYVYLCACACICMHTCACVHAWKVVVRWGRVLLWPLEAWLALSGPLQSTSPTTLLFRESLVWLLPSRELCVRLMKHLTVQELELIRQRVLRTKDKGVFSDVLTTVALAGSQPRVSFPEMNPTSPRPEQIAIFARPPVFACSPASAHHDRTLFGGQPQAGELSSLSGL